MDNMKNLPRCADAYNQAKLFVKWIDPSVFRTRDAMFPLIVLTFVDMSLIDSFPKVGNWKTRISYVLRTVWEVSDAQLQLICNSIEKSDRDMIFVLFGGRIISLSDSCKYCVSDHTVTSFLAKLSPVDFWSIFKQWCESEALTQAETGDSPSEKPVLTISCGDIAVAYSTADCLMYAMRELFSTDPANGNKGPITDFLKTLSYDGAQNLLAQGPVAISLSAKHPSTTNRVSRSMITKTYDTIPKAQSVALDTTASQIAFLENVSNQLCPGDDTSEPSVTVIDLKRKTCTVSSVSAYNSSASGILPTVTGAACIIGDADGWIVYSGPTDCLSEELSDISFSDWSADDWWIALSALFGDGDGASAERSVVIPSRTGETLLTITLGFPPF